MGKKRVNNRIFGV